MVSRCAILVLLLLLPVLLVQCREGAASRHHHDKKKKQLLDSINRPFVKSLNLSDGSIVDCVRIRDQLGLEHPLLKKHKILKEPTRLQQQQEQQEQQRNGSSSTSKEAWQAFQQEHGACPVGSIPVHRLLARDLDRMQNPDVFMRKYPKHHSKMHAQQQHKHKKQHLRPPAVDGHQYAIVQTVGTFSGSRAYLSVWDPAVATSSDFSLSQLWLGAGSGDSINTVEAGWQVYELLNGDRSPHLFIFWTADAYRGSGCYNLRCPGFVQTSPNVLLGGSMSAVSTPGNRLVFKKFLVFKDPAAWWLQIDDEWVGYWPAELFNTLGSSAAWLQWGGEVCLSGASDGPQLSTQMGSGFSPEDGNNMAASQCELAFLDEQMQPHDALHLTPFSTLPGCYAASSFYDATWGSYIVFGGRGC